MKQKVTGFFRIVVKGKRCPWGYVVEKKLRGNTRRCIEKPETRAKRLKKQAKLVRSIKRRYKFR